MAPVNFEVIFITAYSEYAIQALRISALDFLLKPVDRDELLAVVVLTDGSEVEVSRREKNAFFTMGERDQMTGAGNLFCCHYPRSMQMNDKPCVIFFCKYNSASAK